MEQFHSQCVGVDEYASQKTSLIENYYNYAIA